MAVNRLEYVLLVLVGVIKIAAKLQVHPEIRRHPEELCQAQRCTRRDPALGIDDFVDALIGYMDGVGQFALSQTHRSEKLFQEHFTGMSREAMSRDARHSDTSLEPKLVIVDDCYQIRTLFSPLEANTILVVDSQAMLPFTMTAESFQAVSWRDA